MRYLLLLLMVVPSVWAVSVEQKPLVINPTTGKTEQIQTGNTLVLPTAQFIGPDAQLPLAGALRVGGSDSDVFNVWRSLNAQNQVEFKIQLGGSVSGTVPGWTNNAVIEADRMTGGGTTDLVFSAYNGSHVFTTTNLRATRLTVADTVVTVAPTTPSSSTTTGALVVGGGAGIGGDVNSGGAGSFNGNVTLGRGVSNGSLFIGAQNGSSPQLFWGNTSGATHWDMYETVSGGGGQGMLRIADGLRAFADVLTIAATTGNVTIPATSASSSAGTGALVVNGGVGIAGDVYIGQSAGAPGFFINGGSSGSDAGGRIVVKNGGTFIIQLGNKSAAVGGAYDATPYLYTNAPLEMSDRLVATGGVTVGTTVLITSNVTLTNGAAAQVGTLTNAPVAGNPTKWIPINDNGTTRYIPAW